ncbi:MAG: CDP-diacylglycerol--glycerol-3-phosphate 3-phosphatidyltransferase [Sarcina ventriculi]|uniref:CDP-diacylglycerol--glycerol-3-phosphate 3-phosphatidyltransferase n=2 Tax=Sarcina TaxID=1266 RepID=A0ACD1BDT3_9CLOT|nr:MULTISPECIES: CDP-diacylglycerol--glycerol-3-phosphate 3-phosphatidyltransferase [Sarcina]MDO4402730.1 CDP-diacylglycerol--glycerol-3-phosphate 3-phosphatidyltransferase [Clostridiaceae bacterium]MBU5321766.1 CDP-diacylglycerol--glycerol-3-phosphate 3-phosphatidyltransferase [Sarcina ventriculi]MCI5636706.1 CDP-diacylglycerol--glycerol-3-phosphate 3-phosphatidyltransferase [Sarcina ventriculi]MDD7373055.1 CDP-diacylglycerol--glycerol-3-phosphate 3-phosphatidyltransferase [Sarcina ventriculi]
MNLANKLTLLRIFLVPVFLIFFLVEGIDYGTIVATIVFIVASITDQLDGHIARSRNQITTFGKFMDPLADKLLVTAVFVCLVQIGMIPAWAVIIILSREFAVSGLRSIAASNGLVIAASWWGKIKTVTQMLAILLFLLTVNIMTIGNTNLLVNFFPGFLVASNIVFYICVVITIISGIDYFIKNRKVITFDK